MIAAILQAIAALPKLFEFIEKSVQFIAAEIDKIKRDRAARELEKGLAEAKKKDTSKLEDLWKS